MEKSKAYRIDSAGRSDAPWVVGCAKRAKWRRENGANMENILNILQKCESSDLMRAKDLIDLVLKPIEARNIEIIYAACTDGSDGFTLGQLESLRNCNGVVSVDLSDGGFVVRIRILDDVEYVKSLKAEFGEQGFAQSSFEKWGDDAKALD